MLHACFVSIPTCFMCNFIQYLAFSGTNLLTRCRSANSCFLLFCISEKLHMKYSRNWTKQKPKSLIYHKTPGARRGVAEGPGGAQTRPRRGPSPGRAWVLSGRLRLPLVSPLHL